MATLTLVVNAAKDMAHVQPTIVYQLFDLTNNSQDPMAAIRFKIETLEAEFSVFKTESSESGTIQSFPDILPSMQLAKDLEAWLMLAFQDPDVNGNPYNEDQVAGEYLPEDDILTFGPFTDIYVVLAALEELEGVVTRGKTLKEREQLKKSSSNHPGESTVIYALKHTIPNFLSKGSVNSR